MKVFAIHQHELVIGIHVSPHPEQPFHLPPQPILPGCHRAPVFGALLIHQTRAGYLVYV